MTPAAWTGLATVFVALLSAVFVPLYITRNASKKESARRAEDREAVKKAAMQAAEDANNVSWQNFSKALAKERDDYRSLLKASEEACAQQVRLANVEHAREIQAVKERYDYELDRSSGKIRDLEGQADSLYRRLANVGQPKPG